MVNFIIRRLFTLIPMLLGITLLVFLLMFLAPGDFLSSARANRDISRELIQQMEQEYGLDKAWYVQYGLWLENISPVHWDSEKPGWDKLEFGAPNFGYSWAYKVPVTQLLAQRIPASLVLAVLVVAAAGSLSAAAFDRDHARVAGHRVRTLEAGFAVALLALVLLGAPTAGAPFLFAYLVLPVTAAGGVAARPVAVVVAAAVLAALGFLTGATAAVALDLPFATAAVAGMLAVTAAARLLGATARAAGSRTRGTAARAARSGPGPSTAGIPRGPSSGRS
jgi:ABC-type microcin C transport system permease subunit YejB